LPFKRNLQHYIADGMIDEKQAVQIVEPTHIDQLLHPQFKDEVSPARMSK
jgi:hypothetical protein